MPGQALFSSVGCCPVNPQVATEDGDRKPVGGTKMDKDLLARTIQRLRSGVIHKQVASGREFKGRPFNSKPEVVHFKVSPTGGWARDVGHRGQGHTEDRVTAPGSWVTGDRVTAPGLTVAAGVTRLLSCEGQ